MITSLRQIACDDVLTAVRDLPALPSIVIELIGSLGLEELSATQCAARISRDPALGTRILRLANSPFYGRGTQVHSVSEAILVLGLPTVRDIVIAAGVVGTFRRSPEFDHDAFWRHSIGSALCAQALATEMRLADSDLAFTVGLVHDIGRLALASAFARAYAEVERWQYDQDCSRGDAERAVLGVDHAEVGGLIARQWNFAPAIVDAIRQHHAPPAVAEVTLTGIAHVADAIAHGLVLTGDVHEGVPPLVHPVWVACRLADAAYMRVFACTEARFKIVCDALLH